MNLAQHVCFDDFVGQAQNWVTWGQKLGHQAKSKNKLVNTLEVSFLAHLFSSPKHKVLRDYSNKPVLRHPSVLCHLSPPKPLG